MGLPSGHPFEAPRHLLTKEALDGHLLTKGVRDEASRGSQTFRAHRDHEARTLTAMRAAVLTSPGSSPRTIDCADPADAEGRERVTVTGAAIPPVELLIASGATYFGVPPCPYIPGLHGTGITADGRRILFATSAGLVPGEGGSMAEQCLVDPARTLELPAIDAAVAAALANPAPAALGALARGRLAEGETVIVLGASGLVGQIAVQAARAAGARVVAVVRGEEDCDGALARGADAAIDSAHLDVDQLAASLLQATGTRRCAGTCARRTPREPRRFGGSVALSAIRTFTRPKYRRPRILHLVARLARSVGAHARGIQHGARRHPVDRCRKRAAR